MNIVMCTLVFKKKKNFTDSQSSVAGNLKFE